MKKYVVYTVMVGGYDDVMQPLVLDDRFDYVLFTDNEQGKNIGIWQVRTFDYRNEDKTRMSRYPKMHPEELFPEYEASLYIDANLSIADKEIYDKVVSYCEQGVDWAGILLPHPPHPDCIYDHALWAMADRVDKEKTVFEWCSRLRDEGYPRHNGLHENNVIYRKNNECCRQIDELWWELYSRYSRRDQLSLEYAFWKHQETKIELMLPKGERAFDSKGFLHKPHKSFSEKTRSVKVSIFEYVRDRIRASMPEKRERFEDFHYWLYGQPFLVSRVILFLWGMIYTPNYLVGVLKRRGTKRIIITNH